MAIHRDLSNVDLHEPKDINTASAGSVYVSNGAGSGEWKDNAPGNFVFVNTEADFPTPVGGVITLEDNTVYSIGADISTTNKFTLGHNNVISSFGTSGVTLTYSGTGVMFTGTDVNFTIDNARISCPSATLLDISDTTHSVVLRMDFSTIVECAKLAVFTDLLGTVINRCSILDADQGAEYLGTETLRFMNITDSVFASTSASFVGFDLGTVEFESFSMNKLNFNAPAGAVGLAGAPLGANILSGYLGIVKEVVFGGGMDATDGNILRTDDAWVFVDNFGIIDSNLLPLSFRYINYEEDFPAPVGGVITLEPDVVYWIGADITTSNRFALSSNATLSMASNRLSTLTYTGANTMFTGENVNFSARFARFSCPNGTMFDLSRTSGAAIVTLDFCAFADVATLGTLDSMTAVASYRNGYSDIDQGFTILGTGGVLDFEKCLVDSSSATFVFLDLGTSVSNTVLFRSMNLDAPSGAIAIEGAANSANILADRVAQVTNCTFTGGIVATGGNIVPSDIRWNFEDNTGLENSTSDAEVYLTAQTTVTVSAISTFYDIGGVNWASDFASRFTTTTAGVVTYIGERDLPITVTGTATVSKVGGGSDVIAMRIAINGTPAAKTNTQTQNATPTALPVNGLFTLSTGDTVSLQVANNTTTANIVCDNSCLVIRG
jgi:hypothetical protein